MNGDDERTAECATGAMNEDSRKSEKRKRWSGRWTALTVALMVVLVPTATYLVAFFATSWPPRDAVVHVEGESVSASVQISRDGRYVRIDYPTGLYVVDTRLGSPSRSAHKTLFGRFWPEEGFFGVLVERDHVKSEHDPRLVSSRATSSSLTCAMRWSRSLSSHADIGGRGSPAGRSPA